MDLTGTIQAYQTASHLPANEWLVDPAGNLINNQGSIVAPADTYVIGAGAGNVIQPRAGNVIGAGAGNVIGAGAGNVIGAGAGNMRSVQSVGGKRVISGTLIR